MSKRNFFILLISLQITLFSLSTIYAQKSDTKLTEADIPDVVIQALDYEYPGVKVTAWTVENNQFVASFKEDGLKTTAYFSNQGEWVKTLAAISKKELPATITDYIAENYTDYIVANAYLQQKPGARTHYYIEARPDGVGQKMSRLTFSDEGKLMERIDPEGFDAVAKTAADDVKSAIKNNTTVPGAKQVLKDDGKTSKRDMIKEQAEKKDNQQADNAKETKDAKEDKGDKEANKSNKKKNAVEDGSLAENSIPASVKKTLTKKAQRPEELKWYKKDSCYLAKCIVKQEPNEVIITPSGVWQKTYITLTEEKITGNMLKHIKSFYKGYKFAEAKKEVRADKQDRVYVSIYENKDNYKKKIKTKYLSNASYYFSPDNRSNKYLEYYGADPKVILNYPYSTIHENEIVTSRLTKEEIENKRKELGYECKNLYVSCGQLIKRKNYFELIKVWKDQPEDNLLLIIGDGKEEAKYEEYIKENNMTNVKIVGFLPRKSIFEIYQISDAFVFSSHEDIYGHVINEALSQGIPVISTPNVNASQHLIKNDVNGYIINSIDSDEFKESIDKVLTINAFDECIKTAKENTYEIMAKEFLAMLERVAK